MTSKGDPLKIIATNREARFHYFIEETVEAGVALTGTEVKSLRAAKVQMADSYVFFKGGEAFVAHLHINEYIHGNRENHDPMRNRKLLLKKKEIEKLSSAVAEQGKTVVPIQIYFKKGRAKIEIGLAKGKKLHDKRQSEKEKQAKKEILQTRKR